MEWTATLKNDQWTGAVRGMVSDAKDFREENQRLREELAKPTKAPRPAGDAEASRAKDREYVYQIRQRFIAQEAKDEAKALKESNARNLAAYKYQQKAREEASVSKSKAPASKPAVPQLTGAQSTGGALRGAVGIGAAYVGIASAGQLAQMALGYRSLGMIQRLAYQAQFDLRRMFAKVDSTPVVRAVERLTSNFRQGSFIGNSMTKIFTNSFNGLFKMIERAVPYVEAFGVGMMLAFVKAETYVLRARIALVPFQGLIEQIAGRTTLMRAAAIGGGLALATIGVYAVAAAAPVLALGSALTAVVAAFEQASKLAKEWDSESLRLIGRQIKRDLGFEVSDEDRGVQGTPKQEVKAGEDEAAIIERRRALLKARARQNGEAVAAGMAEGMTSGAAGVRTAGEKLALAADEGVRTKAEIHSPSKLFERRATQMGQGAVKGLETSAPAVQRAAEASLVPEPSPGRPASPAAVSSASAPITIAPQFHNCSFGGSKQESTEAIDAAMRRAIHDAAVQIGAVGRT